MSDPVWLIGEVPTFTFKDGLFVIAADVQGLPEVAFTPCIMLQTIKAAECAVELFAKNNGGKAVSMRKKKRGH
jgi:hypothetical protein